MSILISALIGFAVNLDNFIIGMNLGIQGQRLNFRSNLLIGFTTGICAYASTYAAKLISGNFLVYTNLFGAIIMIFFGVYCLHKSFSPAAFPEEFTTLTFHKTLLLGMVLAINCIPPSFSAGIMKLSPLIVAFFSAIFSCLCMYISNRLGHKLVKYRFLNFLTPASAILLIIVGIMELLV